MADHAEDERRGLGIVAVASSVHSEREGGSGGSRGARGGSRLRFKEAGERATRPRCARSGRSSAAVSPGACGRLWDARKEVGAGADRRGRDVSR